MNDEDSSFIAGVITGVVIFIVIIFLTIIIKYSVQEKIEDAKTEHLTITYKNSKYGVTDKEMLVNIMKQHFSTSNWSHIDTKAGGSYVEINAWSTNK